jgi:hypothetical protein
VTFEESVIRELDQIRQAFERAVDRLEERDESRDSEVSDLKRDAGLVSVPTIVVAAATALLQYLAPPQAPAPPRPTASVQVQAP